VLARYQAFLFFPLLLLEAAHPHVASAKAILRGRGRANAIEALLLIVHVAGYATALLVLSPLQAAAFVMVQQGLFGLYLGCAFAPNHKGMPTLTEAEELDFLRRQVLTSRNVAGSRLVDFLRRAQPLVRGFCRQHNLPYTEATMFGSYAEALHHLHTLGAPLRPAQAAGD
jgi:hypothetical protein